MTNYQAQLLTFAILAIGAAAFDSPILGVLAFVVIFL